MCKPKSHRRLHEVKHKDCWIPARNRRGQWERHRFRWMPGLPVRDGDDAVTGTWLEFAIQRQGKCTYINSFFTSLEVAADNVAQIAQAGRARWKIESEHCNTLTNHGYRFQHNFGHGKDGLANLLAFTLHSVLDCVCDHWCRGRARSGTRREFFEELRFLTSRQHTS